MFTAYQDIPTPILRIYDFMVMSTMPVYSIFEVLQYINIIFLLSRCIKSKIDFEKEDITFQFPTIIGIMLIVLSLAGTGYWSYLNFINLTDTISLVFFICCLIIGSFWTLVCFTSDKNDSIVTNGLYLFLYFANVSRMLATQRKTMKISRIIDMSYSASFSRIIDKMYKLQKRVSQFLTSFVLSGPAYATSGFFEMQNYDNITYLLLGISVWLSLPLTVNEWFSDGSKQNENIENTSNDNSNEKDHSYHSQYTSIYYLINAILVLMTTSYTLKSPDLLNSSDGYFQGSILPIAQLAVGMSYFIFKLYVSPDNE